MHKEKKDIYMYVTSLAEKLNDASIDRVMAIDADWNIIAWNKTSEKITGVQRQDILGKNIMEVFPQLKTDEEIISAIRDTFEDNTSFLPSRSDLLNRTYYENHFMPLLNDNGTIIGVMNIMHDMTHRIKAEKQLKKLNSILQQKYQQLEKMNAELSTFTSITGSELKDPIRKVYTSLEMLVKNDGARLSDSSKAGLRRMQGSLNRINLLLDDILALSTASNFSSEFTTTNLDEVLEDVLRAMQGKINESGAVISTASLPVITDSKEMLYHLFYNLLDNAIKFQENENPPLIKITADVKTGRDEAEYHCIAVSDNGIGFEKEDAGRIFNMFERLHSRKRFHGSGIGLTVCRKIVEAHGGYMTTESEPGKGAAFLCFLSVNPELKELTFPAGSLFLKDPIG